MLSLVTRDLAAVLQCRHLTILALQAGRCYFSCRIFLCWMLIHAAGWILVTKRYISSSSFWIILCRTCNFIRLSFDLLVYLEISSLCISISIIVKMITLEWSRWGHLIRSHESVVVRYVYRSRTSLNLMVSRSAFYLSGIHRPQCFSKQDGPCDR